MLRHPNLVDIYELGQAMGRVYISMEWVEGLTLAQLLGSAVSPLVCCQAEDRCHRMTTGFRNCYPGASSIPIRIGVTLCLADENG